MPAPLDLTKCPPFGRLVARELLPRRSKSGSRVWRCECLACGRTDVPVFAGNLTGGYSTNCGCVRKAKTAALGRGNRHQNAARYPCGEKRKPSRAKPKQNRECEWCLTPFAARPHQTYCSARCRKKAAASRRQHAPTVEQLAALDAALKERHRE